MLEFKIKLYSAGPWNVLEDARCWGPLTLATVGNGTYQELFGAIWRITWDRKRGLILQQKQGSDFQEVEPDEPLPVLPNRARHISLAFDQAARPVLAYELDQVIHVRQWNPVSHQYTYQQVDGLDPVLLMDAHLHYFTPDSDVLLYCLDLERLHLQVSHQRNTYQDQTQVSTLQLPAFLDQVAAYPYMSRILLHDHKGAEVRFVSPLYPYRAEDTLSVTAAASGDWDTVGYAFAAGDLLTFSGGPATGLWNIANYAFSAADTLSIAGGPATGLWDSLVIPYSAADSMAVSGSPATGLWDSPGIGYTAGDTLTVTGTIAGGTWT
ncbi:hypothetical protein [Deinococcus roseus]|uniref:Uncharacterized protein n=1 Tax=Deinococcus roseus TaxID=392414 RepID=A0ABQ2DFY2_9DEIO|nr:hypothetical protein [Deinococcus roseus]GGJ56640.1 hypothetical protein GCM10008938_48510 [Deinococcus roseus]